MTIKTGSEAEFFRHGQEVASLADAGGRLAAERILSFEDSAEIVQLISKARLALFRAVRETPGSITQIAQRLHRDRSAVKRDVDELERAGLFTVVEKPLAGHGRMKEVRVTRKSN